MTKTALENKKIQSNERIAADRNAAELKKATEVENMREKHERKENMKDRIAQGIFGLLPKSSFSVRTNFNPRKKDDGLSFKNPEYWNNDPEWYRRYPVDVSAWASINTYNRVGQATFGGRFYTWGSKKWAIPGAMIIHWLPTIGPRAATEDMNPATAINSTLARSRQKVLELNSRSNVDWQPGDLGFNLIASASIMVAIEELRRVLKVYNTWSSKNAYLARHLVNALGFSYNDLVANKSFAKEQLVSLIAAFNVSVVAPKAASYYNRQLFLASNIFADSLSEWAQFYAYKCEAFFRLSNDATQVQLIDVSRTNIHSYTATIWSMINAITTDDSFSEMYNDLRHAFGSEIVQLEEFKLGESATMTFNADKTNRMQIHNIKTLPTLNSDSDKLSHVNLPSWSVHQDTNGWLYQGDSSDAQHKRTVTLNCGAKDAAAVISQGIRFLYLRDSGNQLFDTGDYVPNEDGFLEITRAVPVLDSVTTDNTGTITMDLKSCGTELVTHCSMFVLNNSDAEVQEYQFGTMVANVGTGDFNNELPLYVASLVSTFSWHPIVQYTRGWDTSAKSPSGIFTLSELEYAFVGSDQQIDYLHDLCVQSEFYLAPSQFRG